MLVATFGPNCEWVGKTITSEGSVFVVEDLGPITASDIMKHHSRGHLVWATDVVQRWVGSLARKPVPPSTARPPSPEPAASQPAGLPGVAGNRSEAEAAAEPGEAAEPLPEVEAVGEASEAVAGGPVPTEGAGNRSEAEVAAELGEAAEPLPEVEAEGQAEAAAAERVEERPGDLPPAPAPLQRHSNGFPRDAAVGILHGDGSVEWVFEIGEPVPTPRRRVSCITVADLQAGSDQALRVPIVRGSGRVRYSVVGAAVITADEISADLPSGSKIVLGIKVDEEYRLTVSAYLPATKDVWDDALKLGYADAYPDERPSDEEKPITPSVADVADDSVGEEEARPTAP